MNLQETLWCGALALAGVTAFLAPRHSDSESSAGPAVSASAVRTAASALRDPIDAMVDDAVELKSRADEAGGLEMEAAGFHKYPGDPFGALYAYTVMVPRFDAGGVFAAYEGVHVDVRAVEDLHKEIQAVDVIVSPAHAGHYDVLIQLTQSGIDFAKQRQLDREDDFDAGRTPHDLGVALVANNVVYADFTYGELWSMAAANNGWATVVSGTSLDEAGKIAQALAP